MCSPLNKCGNILRGWDAVARQLADGPDDDLERVLTVRLTVEKDLEPEWVAVCGRVPDGIAFRAADRNKVNHPPIKA
nr:hypothetical protein [Variovorax boronicumulans]